MIKHAHFLLKKFLTFAHRILIQHHANTVFRDQAFSNWKFNTNFDGVVARAPRTLGLAVTFNDEVIGVAWGTADSYILSDGPLFVTVQLIAVDLEVGPIRRAKAFLSLVAGIKQWAASLNASHSFIHVTTGSNLAASGDVDESSRSADGGRCLCGLI